MARSTQQLKKRRNISYHSYASAHCPYRAHLTRPPVRMTASAHGHVLDIRMDVGRGQMHPHTKCSSRVYCVGQGFKFSFLHVC